MADKMAKLIMERNILRRVFNRTAQNTLKKLEDLSSAIIDLEYLREKYEKLSILDGQIQSAILDKDEVDEEEYAAEVEEAEEYRKTYLKCKHNVDTQVKEKFKNTETENNEKRFNLKLPKLELRKFDDQPKNWIGFWSQFQKIHENNNLSGEDKFQYLLQAMTEGSSAKSLVECFPPSAENYQKAVDQLKARFARDDMLIQVYIRELLSLMSVSKQGMELKTLLDKLCTYLQCLETLGITKSNYDTILYPIVESALPENILLVWNRTQCKKQLAPLLEFLKREVESEESVKMARSDYNLLASSATSNSGQQQSQAERNNIPTAACIISNVRTDKQGQGKDICCLCSKTNHNIFQCSKANKMSLEEKKDAIKKAGCCYICFKKGHMAVRCKSFVKCLSCGKRHYVILCPNVHKNENVLTSQRNNETLLQTLMVNITYNGNFKKVRALLDSGAQRSYVKDSITKTLNMKAVGTENIGHTLFGGDPRPAKVHRCFELQVSDINNSFNTKIIALEQSKICGNLPKVHNEDLLKKLKSHNIEISDIKYKDTEIELLIGSDYLGSIMTNNIVSFENNLIAVETKLGWTLQGPISSMNNVCTSTVTNILHVSQNDISNLWNLELLGVRDPFEKQSGELAQKEMLNLFNNNISVNGEGRYEVPLLWKEGCPQIGSNYNTACKRLESTTKKLKQSGNLHSYNQVFQEWEKDNIIEKVTHDDKSKGHYIPHHGVIKLSSTTTKIRPVFDASAKDSNGLSLNSCLNKGLNLIELIPKLMISFRKGTYGVTADIAKAFLQVSIREDDREYLKFLWWEDIERSDKLVTYKHNRVVFGITCSPFLLSATINYHLDNCSDVYKNTAKILKQSFYVDNCVTSFDNENDMKNFILQSKEVMSLAGFDLRGWITSLHADQHLPEVPVLGVTWNTKSDELCCNVSTKNHNLTKIITKRYVLSVTQQVFDPLGILSPAMLIPKRILQKLWEQKYEWDKEISGDLAREFKLWLTNVNLLQKCSFPRRLTAAPLDQCDTSLHIFCDASEDAYAACIYLRTQQSCSKVNIQLVLAKSRIAPANKKMTIPRLELMGAVIASRLYKEVIESGLIAECKSYSCYFWTDSTVVLAWLKAQKEWKPFVSNRIKEIRENTSVDNWYHLPGDMNPADLPSRGCNAKKLLESRWWEGPTWLYQNSDNWPSSKITEISVDEEEVKQEEKLQPVINVDIVSPSLCSKLTYFSKYKKIVRVVAWMLRFNPKHRQRFSLGSDISNDEYIHAEKTLFRLLQKECFEEKPVPSNLNTEKDEEGIIRIKTRLALSHEPKNFVKPILLPGNNKIVQRLVRQRHENLKHAGTQILMSSLRNDFWILNIRRLAKKTISDCVICKRYKTKHYVTPEPPLPTDRIENITAFHTTGIDFAGPLFLRNQEKCWIALFTCATYRAVHLELVESMSTNSFMMALRRFIARRGRVNTIYTDNGTNFQGTSNLLDKVDWTKIETSTADMPQPIKWKFIPPLSPWWGGWWERLIKVVKEMLRRVLGKASVTWIELTTLLCECESVINSRPLTYVTTDSDSLRPLTPMMFLHGLPTTENPDLDSIDANNINLRFRYMEKLRSDFRQRFRNEYISLLISRNKSKLKLPAVGDVVLVESESSRLHWPLGIIKELVTGSDGYTRVARVQTPTGERMRTIQRLYPLELSTASEDWMGSTTDNSRGKPEKIDLPLDPNCNLGTGTPHSTDETPEILDSGESQPSFAATRLGRIIKIPRRFLD